MDFNNRTIFVKRLDFYNYFSYIYSTILLTKFVNIMGGEGHVFDMIQRAKQNRKMLQNRRDRTKGLIEKMNEKPLTGYPDKLPEGKMEQIEKDIKAREHDEKVYYSRFMFTFLGILLLVMFVAWGMWKLLGV